MAEIRRLVHVLDFPLDQRASRLHWSDWRRSHQEQAQRGHVARRSQQTPLPATAVPAVVVVPGTPLLTDALWAKVVPLLPAPARTGRPRSEPRLLVAGLLWMMHHGIGWRAIPREQGSWQTLYSRYRLWATTGVWTGITAVLRDEPPRHP